MKNIAMKTESIGLKVICLSYLKVEHYFITVERKDIKIT